MVNKVSNVTMGRLTANTKLLRRVCNDILSVGYNFIEDELTDSLACHSGAGHNCYFASIIVNANNIYCKH